MADELEKIDILRQRTGVSYKEAKEVLDATEGDVVRALISLEEREKPFMAKIKTQVRTYVEKGSHTKIKVKKGDRELFELPASVGALGVVGALMAPEVAVIGALGAIASKINLSLDHKDEDNKDNQC